MVVAVVQQPGIEIASPTITAGSATGSLHVSLNPVREFPKTAAK